MDYGWSWKRSGRKPPLAACATPNAAGFYFPFFFFLTTTFTFCIAGFSSSSGTSSGAFLSLPAGSLQDQHIQCSEPRWPASSSRTILGFWQVEWLLWMHSRSVHFTSVIFNPPIYFCYGCYLDGGFSNSRHPGRVLLSFRQRCRLCFKSNQRE